MRVLATCLAFASHLGVPAAFQSQHRNVIQEEAVIYDVLSSRRHIEGINEEDGFWDHQGTAFVKVNLSLQLNPASDVSQPLLQLVTLMQRVLWGDHVSIKGLTEEEAEMLSGHFDTTGDKDILLMIDETRKGQAFRSKVAFPFDDTNLISRALKIARQDGQKYLVLTRKRVQPGSGLGGGSADAALVLNCLGKHVPSSEYLKLGSDVPFLASDENVAVVSGVGEVITPVKDLDYKSPLYILIPDEHVITKDIFQKVRESLSKGTFNPGETPISVDDICKAAASFAEFHLFNTLEQCVNNHNVKLLSQVLREHCPQNSFCMSGSGCSFILLGADDMDALKIRQHYGKPLLIVKTSFKRDGSHEANFKYL